MQDNQRNPPAKAAAVIAGVLIVTLAAALWPPGLAYAKGTIALGLPADVAKDGLSFGESYNYGTREEADSRALDECKKQGGPSAPLCHIVATYDHRCMALAMDPAAGTPGFGWDIADTQDLARDHALALCRQSAGPARAAFCEISQTQCDPK